MYHVRKSKSKLKLFHWLFIDLFCHFFLLALGSKTCLKAVTIATYAEVSQRLLNTEVVLAFSSG